MGVDPEADASGIARPGQTGGLDAAPGGVLRFLTCGSVDDGKSTLIGRLIHDCGGIPYDAVVALAEDSRKFGTTGGGLDYALLLDGLTAEREQGITIDVAYRYFATTRRKFIVADAPGHEQYTRNMVTAASHCDAAIVLIDARKGILRQTRRHSSIVRLLGIRHVVIAINKMDLVGYDQPVFDRIAADYRALAARSDLADISIVPISAVTGANLTASAIEMPWYRGPSILQILESIDLHNDDLAKPFQLPIQIVIRPDQGFRGYAGTIAGGTLAEGDRVSVLPSGVQTTIASIGGTDGPCQSAEAGDAVIVTLTDEIDVGRGSILSSPDAAPEMSDQFAADIVWFSNQPLLRGRPYLLQMGVQSCIAQIGDIKHVIDTETFEPRSAKSIAINAIARCNLATSKPLAIEPYTTSRELGGFILIDRTTNETAGAGMIAYSLRRSQNVHWLGLGVSKEQRALLKGQKACCLWLTGLSGSGKSTIAVALDKRLHGLGHHTCVLDGDNVRLGLNRDLGFTDADRVENIRRVAEVGRLMVDAGLIVIVSFISPFQAERQLARERFAPGEFLEIYVDTPLQICEHRDPKGLYKKVRAGLIQNFTGISSPYEPPQAPDLRLAGGESTADALVETVTEELLRRQIIPS